jgi:hypothetical protein
MMSEIKRKVFYEKMNYRSVPYNRQKTGPDNSLHRVDDYGSYGIKPVDDLWRDVTKLHSETLMEKCTACDGIVFIGFQYHDSTAIPQIIKWKPWGDNGIDFMIDVQNTGHVWRAQFFVMNATKRLTVFYTEEWPVLDNKVTQLVVALKMWPLWECAPVLVDTSLPNLTPFEYAHKSYRHHYSRSRPHAYGSTSNMGTSELMWLPRHPRYEKTSPNSLRVAMRIYNSLCNYASFQDIFSF